MVRAIGTMGAVAAIVGGITFASLTSNTVALSPNTLSSSTAAIEIGLTNDGTCTDATAGPAAGMTETLTPGVASSNYDFCLLNKGDTPLTITTAIPQAYFTGDTGILPSDVTLAMICTNGGSSSGTLDQYTGGTALGTLAASGSASDETDCHTNVTLSGSYTGSGGSVPSFAIDFVGNQ